MGIPGYFARAIKANPKSVTRKGPGVARLFLDFNSAVHQGVNSEATEETVIQGACETLRDIIDTVSPTEMFFLSIDGVAPLAKINQQRSRRYLSHKMKAFLGVSGGFDRNAITPGTDFMDALMIRLKKECEEISASRGIRSVFSSSHIHGEGEHKIMDYIRRNPSECSDCVYGLDADLIVLSMMLRAQTGRSPCIVREASVMKLDDPTGYVFLNVDMLISSILGDGHRGLSERDKIMNHVVASFLVGNDFLPALSCRSIKLGCMERICKLATEPLCDDRYDIRWGALAKVIKKLADEEDDFFLARDAKYWSARAPDSEDMQAVWDTYPLSNKNDEYRRIRPGTAGWRPRYYDVLFPTQNVSEIVESYLAGVQWTLYYYCGKYSVSTPEWMYYYAYGPTALDTFNCLAGTTDHSRFKRHLESLPPYQYNPSIALLMVTPESSFGILSPKLKAMATDINFGIAHTFPIDFGVETYLKRWTHECKAKVPPIDLASLKKLPI